MLMPFRLAANEGPMIRKPFCSLYQAVFQLRRGLVAGASVTVAVSFKVRQSHYECWYVARVKSSEQIVIKLR
jgi:hypothetical protein